MNQIERINKYENILNKGIKITNKFGKILQEYNDIQKEIKTLSNYYGSDNWYQDIADYDMKLLPKDIKAGILSEDAIYDLLTNNRTLSIKMLEIATDILKND